MSNTTPQKTTTNNLPGKNQVVVYGQQFPIEVYSEQTCTGFMNIKQYA